MKSVFNIIILLVFIPLTYFLAPKVYLFQYKLFNGFLPDLFFGIMGLFVPMLLVLFSTFLIFILLRKKIPAGTEYVNLLVIYFVSLFLFMNPAVIQLLFGFNP